MPRPKLANVPLALLQNEITRRQKLLPKLTVQRDELNRQIAELQGLAAAETGKEAAPKALRKARRRRRAPNKIGLADTLAACLKGKAKVTIAEAIAGVLAAGYKSEASDFRSVVNNMLLADKRFKRVGRGEFTLKE